MSICQGFVQGGGEEKPTNGIYIYQSTRVSGHRQDKAHSGRRAPPSFPHLADARVNGEVGEVDAEGGQQEVVLAGLALLAADALDGLDLAQALGGGGDGCKIRLWCM